MRATSRVTDYERQYPRDVVGIPKTPRWCREWNELPVLGVLEPRRYRGDRRQVLSRTFFTTRDY